MGSAKGLGGEVRGEIFGRGLVGCCGGRGEEISGG